MKNTNIDVALAALAGLAAVGFGAFAAHGISDPKAVEWLKTAGQYAGVHALAVLAVSALARGGLKVITGTRTAFLVGILLFSGSLIAMAFGGPRWLGAVTPVGGLAMMSGWLLLAISALRRA